MPTEANEGAVVRVGGKIDVHGKEPGVALCETAFARSDHFFDLLHRNDLTLKKVAPHLRINTELRHHRNMVLLQRHEL